MSLARDIAEEMTEKLRRAAGRGRPFRWSEPDGRGTPPGPGRAALLSELCGHAVDEAQAEGADDGLLDSERPEIYGL